jgi:predicted nucleic acid-binding protein
MPDKLPTYAWDSGVFIYWLEGTEPTDAPGMLANVDAVIQDVESDKANLITSIHAYTEVLSAKHTNEQMRQFREFLNRSNVVVFEINMKVADKIEQIRSRCVDLGRRPPKAVDASFAAVAIIHKADMLHAADGGLLALDKSLSVDGLNICRPRLFSGQGLMDLT